MRALLLLFVVAFVAGCSGGESGTVQPTPKQAKPGARHAPAQTTP